MEKNAAQRRRLLKRHSARQALIFKILDEFQSVPAENLHKPGPEGGWSPLQTAYHLYLAETGSLNYLNKKLQELDNTFTPPTLFMERNGWLLMLSLWSPLKFKAPKGVSGDILNTPPDLAQLREQWTQTLKEWENFLITLPDAMLSLAIYRHPRAGRISWRHTLGFMHAHIRHHRRQLKV